VTEVVVAAQPAGEFRVLDRGDQELVVSARGVDVELFEPNARPGVADPDRVMPDVVALFARCAQLGMFSGPAGPVAEPVAVLGSQLERERRQQTWRLRVRELDPRALKVLWNLLAARDLEAFSILTAAPPADAVRGVAPLTSPPAAYPLLSSSLSFALEHVVPARRMRDRGIRFFFARAPDDQVLEGYFAALGTWIELLLLGGYPPDGMPARQSGVIPELAFLYDPVTVEQAFPEAFVCHEDAWNAILNWAHHEHRAVCPLEKVEIR
jgi:hypothetical protein